MDAKVASCNFTKYIKRGPNRWQHCPVVRGKTGRVKQDLVLVEGRIEHHPEGYYSFDWREGGRRHRRALGKDASGAQLALERHVATERARARGIHVADDPCAASLGMEQACKEPLQLFGAVGLGDAFHVAWPVAAPQESVAPMSFEHLFNDHHFGQDRPRRQFFLLG